MELVRRFIREIKKTPFYKWIDKYWIYGFMLMLTFMFPIAYTKNADVYLKHLCVAAFSIWSGFGVYRYLETKVRITWKKAELEELKIEDSILLEGAGLFQGILFIYLNMAESVTTEKLSLPFFLSFEILKWSIPIITLAFYVIRGYGAIKNSPKHRYNSTTMLFAYLSFQFVLFLNVFLSNYAPVYIDSVNVIATYLPVATGITLLSSWDVVRQALSTRYGYKPT